MKGPFGWFAVAVSLALTIGGGVLHGRSSGRWGTPPDTASASARLEQIPARFGDWELAGTEEMLPEVQAILRCFGSRQLNYVNLKTGEVIRAAIMVGPHGPMSVHDPEVCYSGAGMRVFQARDRVRIQDPDGNPHEFYNLVLQSVNLENQYTKVYFGWSDGAGWAAPAWPRWTYRSAPYLFKLQMAYQPSLAENPTSHELGTDFLKAFTAAWKP